MDEMLSNVLAAGVLRLPFLKSPSITADEAAELNGDARRAAAMLARVRPCSDEAWTMVADELRRCGR